MISLSATATCSSSASERTITAPFRDTKVPTLGMIKTPPFCYKDIMMDVCVDGILQIIVRVEIVERDRDQDGAPCTFALQ